MQIFAFGDSITWGSWDKEGGWADRLKCHFYEYVECHPNKWVEVYNLGIPGQCTNHLVKRFFPEVEQRINNSDSPSVFLFAFGANDAAFNIQKNDFTVPLEEYKQNLLQVIKEAKRFPCHILILTITPVHEPSLDSENNTKIRKNEYVEHYNQLLFQLAKDEKVSLIDSNKAFRNTPGQLLCEDGLHPNSAGHQVIFEAVKGALAPILQ